jgi:hypothetical protein
LVQEPNFLFYGFENRSRPKKIIFFKNKNKITDSLYYFYQNLVILHEIQAAIVSSVKTFISFDLIKFAIVNKL